jgi:uncharacterized protein YjbI with pentapeptide repeats
MAELLVGVAVPRLTDQQPSGPGAPLPWVRSFGRRSQSGGTHRLLWRRTRGMGEQQDTHRASSSPPWELCRAEDVCTGVWAAPFDRCLAHLEDDDLSQVLQRLRPGSDIDARGTNIDQHLLDRILAKLRGEDGDIIFGTALFEGAQFDGHSAFNAALFRGDAQFSKVRFNGNAGFDKARFKQRAIFSQVEFKDRAWFSETRFEKDAQFSGAQFHEEARFFEGRFRAATQFADATFHQSVFFSGTNFEGPTSFLGATFAEWIGLDGVQFEDEALFIRSLFEQDVTLGPLVAASNLYFHQARFVGSVRIECTKCVLACPGARFDQAAIFTLGDVRLFLENAIFGDQATVLAAFSASAMTRAKDSSPSPHEPMVNALATNSRLPRLITIAGVDASRLTLTGIDLGACRFAGAYHLDELRMEDCRFARTPSGKLGWRWPPIWFWVRRAALAEEQAWRAGNNNRLAWSMPPMISANAQPAVLSAERIAALYRQLRKAHEDAKNEPGAADFYYGEMEMRRHADSTSSAERFILFLYWLVSGYGLRAIRALAALALLVSVTTLLLMGGGLPAAPTSTRMSGTLVTSNAEPSRIIAVLSEQPSYLPPLNQRWTIERGQQAFRITLGAIAFRDASQRLTTAGEWVTTTARIFGPVLLALAFLAIRGRVKR